MICSRKRKAMTTEEWEQYKTSLEYAEDKCLDEGYDLSRCREELKRLGENETLKAQDAWDMLMSATGGDVKTCEREMLELLYIPPHFTTEIRCVICGPVLVAEALQPCPWCATDLPVVLHGAEK